MPKPSANFANSRLDRQLRALPRVIEREAARAVVESAQLVKAEAARLLQERGGSGRLASRIVVEVSPSGQSARVVAGPRTGIAFARALEFGSATRAARPFLFPAVERLKPKVMQRFREAVAAALKKAAGHS